MPLFIPILLLVWLLVVAAALLLCVMARRTDAEIARVELAPVIDLDAASMRRHSAA
jgi:hypothetical protein